MMNTEKVWQVWDIGQQDPKYAQMGEALRELEKQYELVLQSLPDTSRDIICDYVSLCEAMSWRMLEIACAIAGNIDSP